MTGKFTWLRAKTEIYNNKTKSLTNGTGQSVPFKDPSLFHGRFCWTTVQQYLTTTGLRSALNKLSQFSVPQLILIDRIVKD